MSKKNKSLCQVRSQMSRVSKYSPIWSHSKLKGTTAKILERRHDSQGLKGWCRSLWESSTKEEVKQLPRILNLIRLQSK